MSQCKLKFENPTRLTRSKLSAYKKDQCYYLVCFVFNSLSRIRLGCKNLKIGIICICTQKEMQRADISTIVLFKADDPEKLYRYE